MGEASRRKKSDSTFGRIPKSAGFRGLVVSPPIEIEGSRLHVKSSSLDPQELRFSLLFWDRLVWPASRSIHIAGGPDEEFLESAGILGRPEYTFNGDIAQGLAMSQVKAFADLDREEPGVWAMSRGDRSFQWKEGFFEEGAGAYVELVRAVPIPTPDVPLAEILEFKSRRRDELLTLRHQLDSFVTDVEAAEDKAAALQSRGREVDRACADLLSAGREWKFPVYLANVKASFSLALSRILPAAAGGFVLGETIGLPAAYAAAAAGGAISALEVKGDFAVRPVRRPKSPYQYAYRIHSELGAR